MENSKINLDKIVLIEIPKQHETKIISNAYHFKLIQYINPLIIQQHPILKIQSIRQIWMQTDQRMVMKLHMLLSLSAYLS